MRARLRLTQPPLAMKRICDAREGLIISIPGQDGRGQGIGFKLATLFLQKTAGVDTVAAAEALTEGKSIDVRDYLGAVAVLKYLGCAPTFRFALMTNNPKKEKTLEENGFQFDRTPHAVPPTEHTRRHLEAKQTKLGHRDLVP